MSSTSSSECDCDECCHYTWGLDGNYYRPFQISEAPMYSTMGHPLIYHAQVQHKPMNMRQSSRENRKGNRNCFVKAFQWYTREHVPIPTQQRRVSPDIPGFATWLDAKYGEYLHDNRLNQASHLPLEQTSKLESNPDNSLCDACATKTYKNFRRYNPWGKRKRARKEAGDVLNKTNQSFEFIMRPKDSSRSASECCHANPIFVYKKSITTLISCNMEEETEIKAKSQSWTNTRQQDTKNKQVQEVNQREADKPTKTIELEAKETKVLDNPTIRGMEICQCPAYESFNVDEQTQYYNDHKIEKANKSHSAEQIKLIPIQTDKRKQSKAVIKAKVNQQNDITTQHHLNIQRVQPDVSCQCSEESIKKVDAYSQYQPNFGTLSENTSHISKCKQEKRSTSVASDLSVVKDSVFIKKDYFKKTRTVFINDVAQTSDHSIHLEENVHGYPFFLRIVRADKLN